MDYRACLKPLSQAAWTTSIQVKGGGVRLERGELGWLWPCPRFLQWAASQLLSPISSHPVTGSEGGIPDLCPHPLVGHCPCLVNGTGLCSVVRTLQNLGQPNRHLSLSLDTALRATRTAWNLGRETCVDQPSPAPFPLQTLAGPWLGLAPSCLLTRLGRLTSALFHWPGRLAGSQSPTHSSGLTSTIA